MGVSGRWLCNGFARVGRRSVDLRRCLLGSCVLLVRSRLGGICNSGMDVLKMVMFSTLR